MTKQAVSLHPVQQYQMFAFNAVGGDAVKLMAEFLRVFVAGILVFVLVYRLIRF